MKINPLQPVPVKPLKQAMTSVDQQVAAAKEVRKAFRTFVGETFFGQMLKSLRSTQGEVAYLDGGHAEKVFRGQLDQTLAQQLTETSADKLADPMFRHQFPQQAELLREHEKGQSLTLADLEQLGRR